MMCLEAFLTLYTPAPHCSQAELAGGSGLKAPSLLISNLMPCILSAAIHASIKDWPNQLEHSAIALCIVLASHLSIPAQWESTAASFSESAVLMSISSLHLT